MSKKWTNELNKAIEAGLKASEKIMEIYHQKFDVEIKDDNSPVTIADKTADKIIREYLHSSFPSYAFLTEESEDDGERLKNDYVWIVDPVDGTKDFIAKDDEFTTNIALCYKHRIVVGVVLIPAKGEIYYATENGGAFFLKNGQSSKIHANRKTKNLTVLCSVFHSNAKEEEMISKHSDVIKHRAKVGSSIKACYIAHGKAEISYRMSAGTKEWDTAAFQLIVEEAGGYVLKPNGEPITYNREDVYNREGYLIINKKENFLL